MSRAERKAKHAEANKALWESAENKGSNFHFVDAMRNDNVPLKTEFKPAITVLARKPKQEQSKKHSRGKSTGLETRVDGLLLNEDEEDIDSEEEERREREKDFAKRKEEAAKAREEKTKKYEEVRARIFKGSQSNPGSAGNSGRSSPGSSSAWPERSSSSKPRNATAAGAGSGSGNRDKEPNVAPAASKQEQPPASDPMAMNKDRSMSTPGSQDPPSNGAQLRNSNPNSSNKDIEIKSSSTSNLKDTQPSHGSATATPHSKSQSPAGRDPAVARGLDPNISIKPNASFSEMHAGLMNATRRKSQTDQQINAAKSPPA